METKLSHSQEFIKGTIIGIDIAKSSFESDMQQVEESIKERDEKIRQEAIEEFRQGLLGEIAISGVFKENAYSIIKSYTLPTNK